MRRFALLAFPLLLSACGLAGDPTDGFGGFIADTHMYSSNPNAPSAQSENEKRVRGEQVAVAPLLPETGDVWPGPPPPIPTLQDVQKMNPEEKLPPPNLGGVPPSVFDQTAPKTP